LQYAKRKILAYEKYFCWREHCFDELLEEINEAVMLSQNKDEFYET